MKLRQFIAEREEELIAADGGVLESEARGRQVRLTKIWNPLDSSKRSSVEEIEGSEVQKSGILGRLTNSLDLSKRSNSGIDDSQRESTGWVSTQNPKLNRVETKRNSLFTSWRRETGSTSDLTRSLATSLQRSSNVSLASLDSLASEIEETRRFEAKAAKRGSYHDDLFEDFYCDQLRRMSGDDMDSFLGDGDDDGDGAEHAECTSNPNRRASIDLDERPELYTSRPIFDLTGIKFNCDYEKEYCDEDDDDRSNKGAFEWPDASRKIYEAKSSTCDSSQDLSGYINIDNKSEGTSVTLGDISKLQPKPVSKRNPPQGSVKSSANDSIQKSIGSASNMDVVDSSEQYLVNTHKHFRFSWTLRNESKSMTVDESDRTSITLNEASLPSNRSNRMTTAKRSSWNVGAKNHGCLNVPIKDAMQQDLDLDEHASEQNASLNDCAMQKDPHRRFTWSFRKDPKPPINESEQDSPKANEEHIRCPNVLIDPSIFEEIRARNVKNVPGDQIYLPESKDCQTNGKPGTIEIQQSLQVDEKAETKYVTSEFPKSQQQDDQFAVVEVATFNDELEKTTRVICITFLT
jgi:hypothetical protein